MSRTDPPIEKEEMMEYIPDIFHIGKVEKIENAIGGFLCQNYIVHSEKGKYFLKQYRRQRSFWVREIKAGETFFSDHGVPIIRPIPDRDGRPMFWFDDHWYSLFPFVEGVEKTCGTLSDIETQSLANQLAQIHIAGLSFSRREMPQMNFWDRDRFFIEYSDIRRAVFADENPNAFDLLVRDTLQKKYAFALNNVNRPGDFEFKHNGLLHGDYHVGNIFFDGQGEVSSVFDLEHVGVGPCAFELARCVSFSFYDKGRTEEADRLARLFLDTYIKKIPLSYEEFHKGMKMFMIDNAHKFWVEVKHYMKNSSTYDDIYLPHSERINHLADDYHKLCSNIFPTI